MSDAQKPMADVLAAHRWSPAKNDMRGGCYGCAYHGDYAGWIAHVTPEIDKALGGLTRETLNKPEFRDTGEMVRSPFIVGPELVPERRLHFIPSERWVTDWREVQL